ncbi:MAG: ribokinase [Alkalinema sp. RU_4_3]|nr:ribokinase [Alkalinema sp. RU_4_3]
MTAIVLGSLNMDLVTQVPRLPEKGETLMGTSFHTTPGGKGANQAVALQRLAVPTTLIGNIGPDDFGTQLLAHLTTFGLSTEAIHRTETSTGVALITTAATGDNQIIGIYGANHSLTERDLETRLLPHLKQAQFLLLQLEIPHEVARRAAQLAKTHGLTVLLDPAPIEGPVIADFYPHIDFLLPNEVEASRLVEFPVTDERSARLAAAKLQAQGVKTVIIKLGSQGCLTATPTETFFTPAFSVESIDSVACGDAFAAGLTAALTEGHDLKTAVRWGNAAGALTATQPGAMTALPDRTTFNNFLAQHP